MPQETVFASAFSTALLSWGDDVRRDLPWRRTRDPWAILVSELMLQQTQATRVVPKYEAFLRRFPTPAVCAAAPPAAVIDAWAGLGYNRRALNLHRAAGAIVAEHGGELPDELDALLALPGVGPYTARAVLVFARERDVGVVDVNVGRLLARWLGRSLTAKEAQTLADDLVPDGCGWRWNQALFDLGATVCRARRPACDACPVADWCRWRGSGADPAVGSAAASGRQSRFEGSDRQGRGRLVDALRRGAVQAVDLPGAMGWPDDRPRAERIARQLVGEGLVILDGDRYQLPH